MLDVASRQTSCRRTKYCPLCDVRTDAVQQEPFPTEGSVIVDSFPSNDAASLQAENRLSRPAAREDQGLIPRNPPNPAP
ncbi:hypothetical protein CP533_1624 [Ophiocordyceps camponoti-saundersi (nom. inval.)]|nr:hypothetical protein CP533_1624 [Ophiocordyceps camponoti-saundersi (nom. inval.)]